MGMSWEASSYIDAHEFLCVAPKVFHDKTFRVSSYRSDFQNWFLGQSIHPGICWGRGGASSPFLGMDTSSPDGCCCHPFTSI